MTTLEIALTVTSQTPLSIGAGGSTGTIADKTIVRDGWGRPLIPGSQIKGKTRAAVEQILRGLGAAISTDDREPSETVVRRLFGSPEYRGIVHFADLPGVIGDTTQSGALAANPEQHRSEIRPSVAVNRRRGTAEDARLLFQETALAGTRFFANPAITGDVPDLGHTALLWAGLSLITRWGGASSRGLGWATMEMTLRFDDRVVAEAELAEALRAFVAEGRHTA